MRQEVMKRDEVSWSDGDHKSLVQGLKVRLCFVLYALSSSRPEV